MKDLFKNYHKHKVLSHLSIVGVSLVLAVSVNLLLVGNQSASMLKASVLESTSSIQKADIELVNKDSSMILVSHHSMTDITEISFGLAYNPENLSLGEVSSSVSANISDIENEAGFKSIILSFDTPQNIDSGTTVIEIPRVKILENTSYINVINANFKDSSGETYLLTTSGLIF